MRTRPSADVETQKGLLIWRREPGRWRLAYARRYGWWFNVGLRLGDVTRDGRPELLLTEWNGGSGYCGFRRVLGTVAGHVRELYRRSFCETDISAAGGDLLVELPIGPCPYAEGAAHCYGGHRIERRRWDGTRLALGRVDVRCDLPRLDPDRGCRPR